VPIAGLVLNLSNDSKLALEAIERVERDDFFTIGDAPTPFRLPVVMESRNDNHSRRQLQWLQDLPGIIEVQVVSVDFSDRPDTSTSRQPSESDRGDTSSCPSIDAHS
jgi:nitrate reductase NapAB chaperone NapD